MKKIQKFNNYLNTSYMHKNELHNVFGISIQPVLEQFIPSLKHKDGALFIGAGKLQDIDLEYFGLFFKQLHLTDIDVDSMIDGVKKFDLHNNDIKITRIEYTGYENSLFFEAFSEVVYQTRDIEKLEIKLKALCKKAYGYRFLKDDFYKFNLIYVSPIYTQLIFQQVVIELSALREQKVPEHILKAAEDIMLDEVPNIISQFNDNLIKALHKEGLMVVLSDIFEIDILSDFGKAVEQSLLDHTTDEIYHQYQRTYGYGLGDYGLYHMSQHLEELTHHWFLWPHSSQKHFLIKMIIYKNKEA